MIDIHCHVLPQVDDGAISWEMAERMCAMAASDGITHIVATPHANSHYAYDREAHSQRLAELQRRIDGRPTLSLGCDFHMSFENLEALAQDAKRFSIEGTKYLLIELNEFSIPPNYRDLIFRMRSQSGVRPILTHPERHPILKTHPEQVIPWVDAGCLVQVTANSLTGHWGQRAQSAAIWLLKKGAVHLLATDAHDVEHRPPVLSKAREVAAKIVGESAALKLVQGNPAAVVEDRDLPA